MFEDAGVDAAGAVGFAAEFIEGSGARDVLELVVFEDAETHVECL